MSPAGVHLAHIEEMEARRTFGTRMIAMLRPCPVGFPAWDRRRRIDRRAVRRERDVQRRARATGARRCAGIWWRQRPEISFGRRRRRRSTRCGGRDAPRDVAAAILHCTLGDVLIAAVTILAALVLVGSPAWPDERFGAVLAATLVFATGYTVYSEYVNTVVRHNWTYTPWMPTLRWLGTGIAPSHRSVGIHGV